MSYLLSQLEGRERAAECSRNDAAMKEGRRIVPYTTPSGLAIGIAYIPRPARVEGDAAAIQRALLDPRTAEPSTLPRRLLGYLWRLA